MFIKEKIKKIFKKKTEETKMTTLEQVRKAYEDLSEDDKKSFHQSIAVRVHESVAAQERADGNKDSQTAADREHEALGAEHAYGKGDVEELHETDKGEGKETVAEAEQKKEERNENGEKMNDTDRRLDSVLTAVEKLVAVLGKSDKAEEKETEKLDKAAQKYGMSSQPSAEGEKRSFTDDDVKKLLG